MQIACLWDICIDLWANRPWHQKSKKENTVSKPSSNDGVCRVFAGLVTLKEFERTTFSTWIVSSVLQEFEVSSGLCGILFQTAWAELAQWFHFRYQTLVSKVRIHKPGIFGRLVINCQSIAALPWETGETSRGLDRIFETHAALQGCDSQDDAHRCTNTTYSRYHKQTVSAPSKTTNELLDGRPSWTWRIDPEKPSGLWRNMADPWVLLAWKLTHDSYIHHVFAIFCVLIMFTYIYATGSSSYAV